MATYQEARKIAQRFLDEEHSGGPYVIIGEQEHSMGWVFFWDSRRHQESGNFRDSLVGNAPILLDRETGQAWSTGTARPAAEYVAEYAERKRRLREGWPASLDARFLTLLVLVREGTGSRQTHYLGTLLDAQHEPREDVTALEELMELERRGLVRRAANGIYDAWIITDAGHEALRKAGLAPASSAVPALLGQARPATPGPQPGAPGPSGSESRPKPTQASTSTRSSSCPPKIPAHPPRSRGPARAKPRGSVEPNQDQHRYQEHASGKGDPEVVRLRQARLVRRQRLVACRSSRGTQEQPGSVRPGPGHGQLKRGQRRDQARQEDDSGHHVVPDLPAEQDEQDPVHREGQDDWREHDPSSYMHREVLRTPESARRQADTLGYQLAVAGQIGS